MDVAVNIQVSWLLLYQNSILQCCTLDVQRYQSCTLSLPVLLHCSFRKAPKDDDDDVRVEMSEIEQRIRGFMLNHQSR
jgi:hypothetical protein